MRHHICPFTSAHVVLVQGDDLNEAVKWLAWAEKYGLPRLAASAKRYALENGGNISACPAVSQLSHECLLWLLNARHVEKRDLQYLMQATQAPPGISPENTYELYRWSRGLPPLL